MQECPLEEILISKGQKVNKINFSQTATLRLEGCWGREPDMPLVMVERIFIWCLTSGVQLPALLAVSYVILDG